MVVGKGVDETNRRIEKKDTGTALRAIEYCAVFVTVPHFPIESYHFLGSNHYHCHYPTDGTQSGTLSNQTHQLFPNDESTTTDGIRDILH